MDTWREIRQMALEPGNVIRDQGAGVEVKNSLLTIAGDKIMNSIGKE
jgi:hypothetical protein